MKIEFIDLFCGIGGFRIAAEQIFDKYGVDHKCVFSSEINPHAQKSYFHNFGDSPSGDITQIDAKEIPAHDLLFAGFPCQPFSIIGDKKGFEDTRGTLFFDIARILEEKKPKAFILENVKQLVTHQKGQTFSRIIETLEKLNYYVDYKILNALDYGLPQKRERVFIVGFHKPMVFPWPEKSKTYKTLENILETNIEEKYYASERIRNKRKKKHQSKIVPSIWHENKSGNVSSHPFSCALRAGASYNYLLVDGERRLTSRELLRLQGFPETFKVVVPYSQIRKQTGNAVPVNIVKAIIESFLPILSNDLINSNGKSSNIAVNVRRKKKNTQITYS